MTTAKIYTCHNAKSAGTPIPFNYSLKEVDRVGNPPGSRTATWHHIYQDTTLCICCVMDGIHYMFYKLNYTTNEQCNYLYRSWRILLMYNCLPWQLMVRVMYIYDINQIVYVGRRVMYVNITSRCLITYNNITIWVSIYVHIYVKLLFLKYLWFTNIMKSCVHSLPSEMVVSIPSPPRWLCPLPPLRDGCVHSLPSEMVGF